MAGVDTDPDTTNSAALIGLMLYTLHSQFEHGDGWLKLQNASFDSRGH